MPIEIGQTVSDYQILELLGRGGMGRVYRVRNIISQRVEAMKVLLDDLAADPDLAERFTSEIRTLARLDHPNIAKLHTAITFDNQLLMLMELLEGRTLASRAKQGPIGLGEIVDFTSQTLAALAYAHKAGVIHRDVKPSNVMITPHGIVKLMDFGIAKSESDHNRTRTGMTMGSMLYMSPEQVRGSNVDARSDIYSVGVMLYELVTGKLPFDADNTHAILDAQLNQAPQPPIEVNPALPAALNEIILTAMAKEPMRRFQSADAFRKALDTLAPHPVAAPNAAAAVAALQPGSNRGLWMALGAVACICVLVAGAITLPGFFKSHASSKQAAVVAQPTPRLDAITQIQPKQDAAQQPALAPPVASPTPSPAVEAAHLPAPESVVEPNKPAIAKSKIPTFAKHVVPLTPVPPPPEQAQTTLAEPPPPQAQASTGPPQEEIETVDEELMKLRSRADAMHDSLDHLRSQQAADGLSMNPTVTAGAGRMDNYLHAAGQALQNNNLDSARKYLERAETEITKLEKFFGR